MGSSTSTATWWQGGYKRHDHLSVKNIVNALLFLAAPVPSILVTLELHSSCLGKQHTLDTSRCTIIYSITVTRTSTYLLLPVAFQFPLSPPSIELDMQHGHPMGPVRGRQRPLLPQCLRRILGCGTLAAELLADRSLLEHHSTADCALLPLSRLLNGGGVRAGRSHDVNRVDLERSTDAQLFPARGVEVRREGRLALLQDGHGGLPQKLAHHVLPLGGRLSGI